MCLILDANLAAETFPKSGNKCLQPYLQKSLIDRKAIMVVGGRLKSELCKLYEIKRILRALDQAGAVRFVSDTDVDAAELKYQNDSRLASDDPHVLALASITNTKLLCSKDKNLHIDFKNSELITQPTAIYCSDAHKNLIRKYCK